MKYAQTEVFPLVKDSPLYNFPSRRPQDIQKN